MRREFPLSSLLGFATFFAIGFAGGFSQHPWTLDIFTDPGNYIGALLVSPVVIFFGFLELSMLCLTYYLWEEEIEAAGKALAAAGKAALGIGSRLGIGKEPGNRMRI